MLERDLNVKGVAQSDFWSLIKAVIGYWISFSTRMNVHIWLLYYVYLAVPAGQSEGEEGARDGQCHTAVTLSPWSLSMMFD